MTNLHYTATPEDCRTFWRTVQIPSFHIKEIDGQPWIEFLVSSATGKSGNIPLTRFIESLAPADRAAAIEYFRNRTRPSGKSLTHLSTSPDRPVH